MHDRKGTRPAFAAGRTEACRTAAVILITNDELQKNLCALRGQGISAVIARPASVDQLRRIVEFGLDGWGLQPPYVGPPEERRKPLALAVDGASDA